MQQMHMHVHPDACGPGQDSRRRRMINMHENVKLVTTFCIIHFEYKLHTYLLSPESDP